jgi:outer membrane protein TolC
MLKNLVLFLFILFPVCLKAQEKNLDYFINQAKTNSPLLNDYQNQLLILSLDSSKIKAGLKPQVSGSSNLLYAPIISGIGYDPAITNGQIVSALVSVSKEITTKARLNTLLKSLQLTGNSLSNQRAFTVLDLEKGISAQYITTWGDHQFVQLAKETLQLLEKQDTLLKKLTQGSVFKQTEYLAFKVNLEQQYLTVLQSQNQYKNDFAALNYLSGIADTIIYTISYPLVRVINVPKFDESLLFKKYQIDSLKTLNALDQLSLNYKPKLNVFADAGYLSSLPKQAYKNFGWTVGLNLSIPIYDGGLRKLSTQQINLNQKTQNKYRDFYRIQYDQQRNQLQRMIDQYESLINKANKQLNYSKTLIDANALQLKTGDVRMTDYLIAINNYLNLRVNIIQNKNNLLQMINQQHYFILK